MKARVQSQRWLHFIKTASLGLVTRFIALGFVVAAIAIAASHFRHTAAPADDVVATAPDSLLAELKRCRAITPDQLALDDICRRVWAENRRRFLTPSKPAEVR